MSDNGSGRQPGGGRLQSLLGMLTRRRRGGEETLRDAIEELIEDEPADTTEGESIRRDERHLLLNVLALRERTAVDVMVPRADIIAVPVGSSYEEVVRLMIEAGHSRLPVFRETLDDVIGFVHIRDVLACAANERPFDLKELCRTILFVAPSMPALDLLLDMQLKRQHIALVIDEFGGVDGLVTLENAPVPVEFSGKGSLTVSVIKGGAAQTLIGTTYTDDFNRPDGPPGNGWVSHPDWYPGRIIGQRVTNAGRGSYENVFLWQDMPACADADIEWIHSIIPDTEYVRPFVAIFQGGCRGGTGPGEWMNGGYAVSFDLPAWGRWNLREYGRRRDRLQLVEHGDTRLPSTRYKNPRRKAWGHLPGL